MRRHLPLLVLACVAMIFVAWWLLAEMAPAPPPAGSAATKAEPPTLVVEQTVPLRVDRALGDEPHEGDGGATPGGDAAMDSTRTGYIGRVVGGDRSAVPGIGVQLLRVAPEMGLPLGLDVFARAPAAPELVVAKTLTDAEGRFALGGIAPRGLCGLRLAFPDVQTAPIRFRSGQGTFVLVQQTPGPGEIVDLGDVLLKTGGTLTGRVVGSDGPLGGARIRAAALPPLPFAAIPIERLRGDGALVLTAGGDSSVLVLPEWFRRVLEALPIAEAHTADDGTFVVHGVDTGELVVAVTAPRRASLLRQGVKVERGAVTHLGELHVADGGTAEVRVVDTAGEAVAGAEVLVAPMSIGIPVHIAEPAGCTDGEGRVVVDGLPRGRALAAARRSGDAAWTVGEPGSSEGTLRVVLPGRHEFLLTVLDAAGRVPADIRVRIVAGAGHAGALEFALFGLRQPVESTQRVERLEDGRLRVAGLAAGRWCVVVGAAACASQSFDVELRGDLARTVTLRPARALRVRTVDAAGDPVAGAVLHMMPSGGSRAERIVELPLAVGSTGLDGWCTVRDLPTEAARITAVHPRHGQVHALVQGHPAELLLAFAAPASIRGVLTDGGRPPAPGRWVMVLERRYEGGQRGAMPDLPQLALAGLDGSFGFPALQPGRYRVTAQDSLADIGTVAGMVHYMARQKQILPWNKAEVELRPGEVATVRLDAILDGPAYDGPGAGVRGIVTIDGAPAKGAVVVGTSKQPDRRITSRVDASGTFDLGRCPAGDLRLVVVPYEVAESRLKENLFSHCYARDLQVLAEQPLELRIDVRTGAVFGEVRDGSGAVVDDCRVVLFDRGGEGRSSSLRVARSDRGGTFSFPALPAGVYELRAEHEQLGKALVRQVVVTAGGAAGPLGVLLVAVARKVGGRVEWASAGSAAGMIWLHPRGAGEENGTGVLADGRFEFRDVPVGIYGVEVARQGDGVRRQAGEIDVRAPTTLDLVVRPRN